MRLNFCKLCQFASTLHNGGPIIVGVFSRMWVPAFPSGLDPSYAAFELEFDAHEMGATYDFEMRLIDEDGNFMDSSGFQIEMMPAPDPFPKQQFGAPRIPWHHPIIFSRPGTYRFDIVVRRGDEEEILGGTSLVVHA